MYDSDAELNIAEEKVKKFVESIQDKTIFDVDDLTPHEKRNLVNQVNEESIYYESFQEYIGCIASEIAKMFIEEENSVRKVSEQEVMVKHVMLQDLDDFKPDSCKTIKDIGLISDDSKQITSLVNQKLTKHYHSE